MFCRDFGALRVLWHRVPGRAAETPKKPEIYCEKMQGAAWVFFIFAVFVLYSMVYFIESETLCYGLLRGLLGGLMMDLKSCDPRTREGLF